MPSRRGGFERVQRVHAEAGQQAGQGDQGQSDQGGGVVAFYPFHERDAQGLGLGAARRIVGTLGVQVGAQRPVGQVAQHAARRHDGAGGALAVIHGHGRMEGGRAPPHCLQLRKRLFEAAGFADGSAVHRRDLVRPDYQRAWVGQAHGAGLGQRQAQGQVRGGSPGRGVSSTPGAVTEKGSLSRSSSSRR